MSEVQMNAAREEVERQKREADEMIARQAAEIQKQNREADMLHKFMKICVAIAGSAIVGMILTLLFIK